MLQIAIRKMLHDDNSMAVMLLFGCIGLLNAVCLAPVLLILHLAGSVHFAGLSARVLGLTVCKGAPLVGTVGVPSHRLHSMTGHDPR